MGGHIKGKFKKRGDRTVIKVRTPAASVDHIKFWQGLLKADF